MSQGYPRLSVTGDSTTKDSLLHFVAKMLCSKAWMRTHIENVNTLSPLERDTLEKVSITISASVRDADSMDIPMEFRNLAGYTKYSFEENDWKQVKLLMFDYEIVDTWMGTYVRLHPMYVCILHDLSTYADQ
jgi:hypothetical protein